MRGACFHRNPLQKVQELHALEHRLKAACFRAEQSGNTTLAASYLRQSRAVRIECDSWLDLVDRPIRAPRALPNRLSLARLFSTHGPVVTFLSRLIVAFLILLRLLVAVLGCGMCTISEDDADAPQHWVVEIAEVELERKRKSALSPCDPWERGKGHD